MKRLTAVMLVVLLNGLNGAYATDERATDASERAVTVPAAGPHKDPFDFLYLYSPL
jgi:hypothetical protein